MRDRVRERLRETVSERGREKKTPLKDTFEKR